jgi:hypothetical protein
VSEIDYPNRHYEIGIPLLVVIGVVLLAELVAMGAENQVKALSLCRPLWVKTRHCNKSAECLLYTRSGHVRCKHRCPLSANSAHLNAHSITSSARGSHMSIPPCL